MARRSHDGLCELFQIRKDGRMNNAYLNSVLADTAERTYPPGTMEHSLAKQALREKPFGADARLLSLCFEKIRDLERQIYIAKRSV